MNVRKIQIHHYKVKKYMFSFLLIFSLIYLFKNQNNSQTNAAYLKRSVPNNFIVKYNLSETEKIPSKSELQILWMKQKIQRLSKSSTMYDKFKLLSKKLLKPNRRIHIFYHAQYRSKNPPVCKFWNPSPFNLSISHFGNSLQSKFASSFYPALGCYDSHDPSIILQHMKLIRDSGIGVVIVTWCPLNSKDFPKNVFLLLLDSADTYDLQVAVQFQGCTKLNNPGEFILQVQQIIQHFGMHKALYRFARRGKLLPVFYIYNTDKFPNQFKQVLSSSGNLTIRETKFDGVFFGLLSDFEQRYLIKKSEFDGFYTYFGSNGFTYGSSWKNWQSLSKFAQSNSLLFSPSVAPGFSNIKMKLWNPNLEKHRRNGRYYEVAWQAAIAANPPLITITSFNNWLDGTQIEPAVPKKSRGFIYLDYSPYDSYYYMNLTKYWITVFTYNLVKV